MEYREWSLLILSADTLENKLFTPDFLTDNDPGSSIFWDEPSRPLGMQFKRHTKEEKLPSFQEHNDPEKVAICLHRFAGHELLAVEIMAFALLAFPQAPASFRKGVAHTLKEEQEHVRLYMKRMKELHLSFGDLPLYRHFWAHTPYIRTPNTYLSAMSLTFEQANLDFAPHYGKSFERHGDLASAALMKRILLDEIRHVSFGIQLLKKFFTTEKHMASNLWDYWLMNQTPHLYPKRATGFIFSEKNRKKAGIPKDWIEKLNNSDPSSAQSFRNSADVK